MTNSTDTPKNIHQGRNVKRFREMMGIKQESLADTLGDGWSQKKISFLEASEVIEQELLDQVAAALKVPAEAIKNFDEETAIYNIQNNYEGSKTTNQHSPYYQLGGHTTFHPLDKYVAAVEKNDALVEEVKKLYEALLKAEREKNALLEKLLNQKG